MSNFMIIRPVRPEVIHVDGRTDGQTGMTKLIVAFSNFVNAPKAITIVRLTAPLEHSYKTGLFPHCCPHSTKIP